MKFMAKWDNTQYVVEPKDRVFLPGGKVNKIAGLRAEFTGRSHIFDSEVAAKSYRWSDKQKKQVEEYLVSHPDFGHAIYLAPGQEVPTYLQKAFKAVEPADAVFHRCGKIDLSGDTFVQCENEAILGKDFCEAHIPGGIIQGVRTTTE